MRVSVFGLGLRRRGLLRLSGQGRLRRGGGGRQPRQGAADQRREEPHRRGADRRPDCHRRGQWQAEGHGGRGRGGEDGRGDADLRGHPQPPQRWHQLRRAGTGVRVHRPGHRQPQGLSRHCRAQHGAARHRALPGDPAAGKGLGQGTRRRVRRLLQPRVPARVQLGEGLLRPAVLADRLRPPRRRGERRPHLRRHQGAGAVLQPSSRPRW